MKIPKISHNTPWHKLAMYIIALAGLILLMLYKLGNLTGGISLSELKASSQIIGWHGIYHNPLFLPFNILRSVIFSLIAHHSAFLIRLPSAIFGGLAVASFGALSYLWHGKRTAYLATIMFACSAWVLHVSRLSGFDVVYLWAVVSALLAYAVLNEFPDSRFVWYSNAILLGLFLTIPGMLWLVAIMLIFEREQIKSTIRIRPNYENLLSLILLIVWLIPVIIRSLMMHTSKEWLGLPAHFPTIAHLLKDFLAVPVHLLLRGPLLPGQWLGKTPVLDAFSLAMLLLGAYFYGRHLKNKRSQIIGCLLLLSIILIGLGGDVSFSLIIPIAYLLIAMGLAYVVHVWKQVFPTNPVAHWIGLSLIILAIVLSCSYNLSAYFIAWPHNPTTYSTFDD